MKLKGRDVMTKDRTVYHVTYDHAGEHWQVKQEADASPAGTYSTKEEAVSIARGAAQGNRPSQLIIHKMDGQIQEEYTYGDDPAMYPG